MRWRKQGTIPNCGVIAVAVVADCSIKKAVEAIGLNGRASTTDLARGLRKLGFKCPSRLKVLKNKPKLAIGKLKNRKWGSHWHWVVIYKDKIFDGNFGNKYGKVNWKKGWRITSYLPITKE